MPDTFVLDIDIPEPSERIKQIMSVSEQVTEYINTQQYLLDTENVDNLDENVILSDCYKFLIEELQRKGIVFTKSVDELLECWYHADRIYQLYCWIMDSHQVEMCKSHTVLIEQLNNILQFDLADENLLTMWCQAVEPIIASTDPYFTHFTSLLPDIETTDDLKDLLTTLYQTVADRETDFTQPLETIVAYINAMYDGQKLAKKAFAYMRKSPELIDYFKQIDADRFARDLDYYDTDKLQPLVISKETWAWAAKKGYGDAIKYEDLPDNLQKLVDDLDYEHHTTIYHHLEYYLVHKDVPMDTKAIFILICTCCTDGKDKLEENCKNMLASGGDRFTRPAKELFLLCKQVVTTMDWDDKE